MNVNITEYPIRWFILTLFSLSIGCNAMVWISISPILSVISDVMYKKTYNVAEIWVELSLLVYMIVFVLTVFPFNYLIELYGLRFSILAGIIFTTIGASIRIGAIKDFWYILIGNTIAAFGQPFLINVTPKVAETWFRPERRTMATTIGIVGNFIGIILGFVIPAILVTSDESKSQISMLMLVEAIMCFVTMILCIFWFEDKPAIPPSISASEERENFCKSLTLCLKNSNFLLVFFGFSLIQGTFGTLVTLLDPITSPYGFSSTENSIFGIVFIVFGVMGSLIIGLEVTATNKYKLTCFITCLLSLLLLLIFAFTLELESVIITSIALGLLGLVSTPSVAISYEFVIELTYPVEEAVSVALLNTGAMVFGVIQIGIGYLFGNSSISICLICAVGLAIATLAFLLSKEELIRSGVDNKKIE